MIEKERLEELIQQNATIFYITHDNDFNCIEVKPDLEYLSMCDWNERLFETKEEAEFKLEFGNLKRTETLVLPTWEEMQNLKEFNMVFNDEEYLNYFMAIETPYQQNYGKIIIACKEYKYIKIIFDKIFNKKNYIEACRLCKKLFMGE